MRNALISWLCEQAVADSRIILLTADLGFSVVEPFAEKFPRRFINVGVAEQNMVGVAAGLALEGFRPYTYSIGIFPTFRCAEQLRNDIDYHNLPVCTCTVGSGVAYGSLGYTHHAIQDLALMRSLPATVIATPSDPQEVLAVLNWQINSSSPVYLRLHKKGEQKIHQTIPDVEPCRPLKIYSAKEASSSVVVIGFLVCEVIRIVKSLGLNVDIYTLPLWGTENRNLVHKSLCHYEKIVTVEDHMFDGGFGSWMLETFAVHGHAGKCLPVSLPSEVIGQVASEMSLLKPLLDSLSKVLLAL